MKPFRKTVLLTLVFIFLCFTISVQGKAYQVPSTDWRILDVEVASYKGAGEVGKSTSWDPSQFNFKGADNAICSSKSYFDYRGSFFDFEADDMALLDKETRTGAVFTDNVGKNAADKRVLYLNASFAKSPALTEFFKNLGIKGGDTFPIYKMETRAASSKEFPFHQFGIATGVSSEKHLQVVYFKRDYSAFAFNWEISPLPSFIGQDIRMRSGWKAVGALEIEGDKDDDGKDDDDVYIRCFEKNRLGFAAANIGDYKAKLYSVGFVGETERAAAYYGLYDWVNFAEVVEYWNQKPLLIWSIKGYTPVKKSNRTVTAENHVSFSILEHKLDISEIPETHSNPRVLVNGTKEFDLRLLNSQETDGQERPLYLLFNYEDLTFFPKIEHEKPLGQANLDFCGDHEWDASKILELDYSRVRGKVVRVCFKKGTIKENEYWKANEFLIKLKNWNGEIFKLKVLQDNKGLTKGKVEPSELDYALFVPWTWEIEARRLAAATPLAEELPATKFGWNWEDISSDECSDIYCDADQFTKMLFKRMNYLEENRDVLLPSEVDELVHFPVFLKHDGFSEDFFADFKEAKILADTPAWFTEGEAFEEFLADGRLVVDYEQLDGPGLYDVSIVFERDGESGEEIAQLESFESSFFYQGTPNGKLIAQLTKIREPEVDYPLLHIPFDGVLGKDGHREGYGVTVKEGPSPVVYVDNAQYITIPRQVGNSQPIDFIYSNVINDPSQPAVSIRKTASYEITTNTAYVQSVGDAFQSPENIEFTAVESDNIVANSTEPTAIDGGDEPKEPVGGQEEQPDSKDEPDSPGVGSLLEGFDSITIIIAFLIAAFVIFEVFAFKYGRERLIKKK